MPTNCVVPFCTSDSRKKIAGISFHEFPSDEETRDKWIRAVRRKDPVTNGYWIPSDRSLLCSLHFAASCFRKNLDTTKYELKRNKLVRGSVPTIFPLYSQLAVENVKAQKSVKRKQQKPPKEKQQKPLKEKNKKPLKEKQQNIISKQERPIDLQQHSKWSSLLEVACAYELASEIEALSREPIVEASSTVPSAKASSIVPSAVASSIVPLAVASSTVPSAESSSTVPSAESSSTLPSTVVPSIVTNIEVLDEHTLEAFTTNHATIASVNESTVDTSVIDELTSEFDLDSTLAVVLIKNSPSVAAVTSQVSQSEPSPQETFRDPNAPHCAVPLPGGSGSGKIIPQKTKDKSGVRRRRKNTQFLNKVAKKTKSDVDAVITTQDPGMKESINSGGDIRIVVTSGSEVMISAVREAFQLIFGKAVVEGILVPVSSIAPQPVGFAAGLKAAEEQISNLRQQGNLKDHQVILAIANFITEFTPENWFDIGCLLLQDYSSGISLQMYTEPISVSRHFVSQAKDQTPADYPLGWSGHAVTIGQIIGSALCVPPSEWHQALTGVSQREILFLAAKTLAGLYKAQLGR